MPVNNTILVVEDEAVAALDLQMKLNLMGYHVPKVASSSDGVTALLNVLRPDLALIDINLGAKPDGIDIGAKLRDLHGVPVIYVTALTDDETLERARLTEPYGYLMKPVRDRELEIAVEIALSKHKIEQEKRDREFRSSSILKCLGSAVIAAGSDNRVNFINPAAEQLTGWNESLAIGTTISTVFNVRVRQKAFGPWFQLSSDRYCQTKFYDETILISREGRELPVQSRFSLITDEMGRQVGDVVVFHETDRPSAFLPVLT